VPTSLLASCSATSTLSGRSEASSRSGSITPSGAGGTVVTAQPSSATAAAAACTEGCSSAAITKCPRKPERRAADQITALFASVPEPQKTTSSGFAPTSRATCSRASSTAAAAA